MTRTLYFETGSTDPAWNLAFEEYIFTHRRTGNILILWQNDSAVIVGRNQNTAREVDSAYAESHGIRVIRRNTGGGAVYHDLGNLNYSFIADDTAPRSGFTGPVVQALRDLGLDAAASGRNDILISGKKVSGTAQQIKNGRILHHGTLLFDTDSAVLCAVLTPDPEKYRAKGIPSVPSRVGNIREFLGNTMDLPGFWAYLKEALGSAGMTPGSLSPEELSQVEQLRQEKYAAWDWNYGHSPAFDRRAKQRFDRGTLDIGLSVENGRITAIRICGDFLGTQSVAPIEGALTGCPYRQEPLLRALEGLDVPACLGGITAEECIHTLLYS